LVRIIGGIVLLLIGAMMILELPVVQKKIVDKVLVKFNSILQGEVSIGKIGIRPFNAFYIEDILILDKSSPAAIDTFFRAEKLSATVSLWGLLTKEGVHLGKVKVENGVFHLVIEQPGVGHSNLNRIFGIIPPSDPPPRNETDIFDIRTVRVRNVRYRMTNLTTRDKHKGVGINWGEVDVVADEIDGWMRFSHSTMFYRVDHLAMHEKSGYVGIHLSGHGEVGHGRTIVKDFHLEDLWSKADFPEFTMTYGDVVRMRNFVNNVVLETYIKDSRINLKTISFFTGIPFNDKICLNISEAHQIGTINDLRVKYFRFTDEEDGLSGNLSGRITHLTHGQESVFTTIRINDFNFTTAGLQQAMEKYDIKLDIKKYAPGEKMNLNLRLLGPVNKLKCDLTLNTESSGALEAKAEIRDLMRPERNNTVSGVVETDRLHLGKLLGNKILGTCTMGLGGDVVLAKKNTQVRVDSLRIKEIEANGYKYTGIAAKGSYDGNLLNAKVISSDPNLNFLMQGNFVTSPKTTNTLTKFYLNVGNADLAAIKIDKNRPTSKVSFVASGQLMSIAEKDMVGNIDLENLTLEDNKGVHNLGDVSLYSSENNNLHRIQLKSSFADGSYVGEKSVVKIISDIIGATVDKSLPALMAKKKSKPSEGQDCGAAELNFKLKDTKALCNYLVDGLFIANGTNLKVNLSKKGDFTGLMESQRIALDKNYIKNFCLNANNDGGALNAQVVGKEIKFNNIQINGNTITSCSRDNNTEIHLHYDEASIARSTGDLNLSIDLYRNELDSLGFVVNPKQSLIKFNDFYWTLDESKIRYDKGEIDIDNFRLHSDSQSIYANGRISRQNTDSLRMEIQNFDLKLADETLLGGLGLEGMLNAKFIFDLKNNTKLSALGNASIDNLAVGGNPVGSISADGNWNARTKLIEVNVGSDLNGKEPLKIKGTINPSNGHLDIHSEFDKFNIAVARPFVRNIFSEIGGYLNGKIDLDGSKKELSLNSKGMNFEDARIKLAFTNVAYTLNGPFTINNKGIQLKNVQIKDDESGAGTLNGGLLYDHLKNPRLDARVKVKELSSLQIAEHYGGLYGKLYTNLDVHIYGPFNNITIEGSAGTAKNGSIHIPLSTAVAATNNDILTFADNGEKEIDEYEEQVREISKKLEKTGINLKMQVKADRNTEICVDVNKSTGNYATIRGNGQIGLDMRSMLGEMILAGNYEITEGKYHFSIPGIVNKDFLVNPGSYIKLNGNIENSDINLSATYKVKTSLSTLLADTTTVSSRRPVECIISISDKLSQPKIGFGVEVKDLDPTTKARVEAALNTEDKVQKQFVALLVMGMFIPDEQSTISSGSNIIFSNVSQVLSNQLNTIMQRLNIPVDLGLGYQQNMGNDIFDVAISTQLFNNRVVVNGSVGNKKLSSSSRPGGDVVGDIAIEVKIDKPGNLRLKLFSHSADQYTSFLDYSQRNGVGISYQKEYSNFFEMIRSIFYSKTKREEKEKEKAEKNKDLKKIDIK